jgi:hypothetical protein
LVVDIGIPVYVKSGTAEEHNYSPGEVVRLKLNTEKIRAL